jgi:hypothetical protein
MFFSSKSQFLEIKSKNQFFKKLVDPKRAELKNDYCAASLYSLNDCATGIWSDRAASSFIAIASTGFCQYT